MAPVVMLDWFFHMPLQQGLAEGWLVRGDVERARRHAAELVDRAGRPPERHFLAVGHDLAARAALAAGDLALATRETERALAIVQTVHLPLAAWRTFETAAEILDGQAAARYRAQSAAILRSLAESLGKGSELGKTLLAAPRVRSILRDARTAPPASRTSRSA